MIRGIVVRKLSAEVLGTGLLAYLAVGVATLAGGGLAAGLHRLLYLETDETLASGDLPTAAVG